MRLVRHDITYNRTYKAHSMYRDVNSAFGLLGQHLGAVIRSRPTMVLGSYLGHDCVDYILVQLVYPCPIHEDRPPVDPFPVRS